MSAPLLWLLPSSFVGGPERQTLLAARTLRDQFGQDSVFVVMPAVAGAPNPFCELARAQGFRTDEFVTQGRYEVWRARRAWRERVAAVRPRAIFSLGYRANFLTANSADVPAISYVHGFTGADWRVSAFEAIQRRFLLSRHAAVAVLSYAQMHELEGLPCHRVPNAWDPATPIAWEDREQLRREWGVDADDRVLGFVGRLSAEKRANFLLECWPRLERAARTLRLVIVGDGPERRSLEAFARTRGVADAVRFVGFRADAARLMRGFDALVLPSRTEGLPQTIFEAFHAGLPVVASRVGGVPEQLGPHETCGWGFDTYDPSSLAVGVRGALSFAAREKSRWASDALREEWTPENQARALLGVLSSLKISI